ncbi:hypothetical protein IQ255_09340 [Pleurocapsales cyanobacterium LEGE 10410]|nr:hypothetical protein [Pleurocapsales cyanobacterium LEGE 10410]
MEDLVIALKSEVMGEAFFRSAYYATFFSDRRNKAKMLWQLEVQTKTRIIEYFQANHIKVPKLKWAALKGSIFGIFYSIIPWYIVIKEILKETEYYLAVFHRLEKQANEKDKELFEYIVAHEVAIANFAEIELINSSNNSLKSIESLLNN